MIVDPYIKYDFIPSSSKEYIATEDGLIIYKTQNVYHHGIDCVYHLSFNSENDYILWKIRYNI